MDMSSVNWLAVVVCVIVAMVSGFIWYHPSVFFKAWWQALVRAILSRAMQTRSSTFLLSSLRSWKLFPFLSC